MTPNTTALLARLPGLSCLGFLHSPHHFLTCCVLYSCIMFAASLPSQDVNARKVRVSDLFDTESQESVTE